jgi:hypothetical protein
VIDRGRSNWFAGVVVGVAAGVLTLSFPTLGWLIALAFLLGLIKAPSRLPAVGGLFIGLGTAWLALLARSDQECHAFDAAPGQECGSPDIGGWLAVGGVLLAIGVISTVIAHIRVRWRH